MGFFDAERILFGYFGHMKAWSMLLDWSMVEASILSEVNACIIFQYLYNARTVHRR